MALRIRRYYIWKIRRKICKKAVKRCFPKKKWERAAAGIRLLLAAELLYGFFCLCQRIDDFPFLRSQEEVYLSGEKEEKTIFGFQIRWKEGVLSVYKVREHAEAEVETKVLEIH